MRDLLYKWGIGGSGTGIAISENSGVLTIYYPGGTIQTAYLTQVFPIGDDVQITYYNDLLNPIIYYKIGANDNGDGTWVTLDNGITGVTLYESGIVDNLDDTYTVYNLAPINTVYKQGAIDNLDGTLDIVENGALIKIVYDQGVFDNLDGTWSVFVDGVFDRTLFESGGGGVDPREDIFNYPTAADILPPSYGLFLESRDSFPFQMEDFLFLPVPVNTVAPVASNTVIIGNVLSCTQGTWTDADTYAYQWYRTSLSGGSDIAIGGATSSTYTVVGADIAHPIYCEVTATGPGGATPANSNSLANNMQPILAFDSTAWICVRTQGISVGIGAPIPSWASVDNQMAWTQGITASQPTMTANGPSLDGSDDHMIYDAGAARGQGAYTAVLLIDGVVNDGINTERTWLCFGSTASGGNTIQTRISYSRPDSPNGTRQRVLQDDGTTGNTITLTSYSPGANNINLAVRIGNVGGTNFSRADTLTNPLVQIGADALRPANAITQEWLTFGSRRVAAIPSNAQYALGTCDAIIVGSFSYSAAQLQIVRNCLIAEGLM